MGVPNPEVAYTSATTGRGDHEVHKGHVVALSQKKFKFFSLVFYHEIIPVACNLNCHFTHMLFLTKLPELRFLRMCVCVCVCVFLLLYSELWRRTDWLLLDFYPSSLPSLGSEWPTLFVIWLHAHFPLFSFVGGRNIFKVTLPSPVGLISAQVFRFLKAVDLMFHVSGLRS
jgi:hypothetical protein